MEEDEYPGKAELTLDSWFVFMPKATRPGRAVVLFDKLGHMTPVRIGTSVICGMATGKTLDHLK